MSLFVEEVGTGHCQTIVFLHGLITSGWMWQQPTQQLQDFHCLVPDLPQHGHSRHIKWRSIEETARQVADLIRQRAYAGRAHLVGLSLGSLIALQVMRTTPDLVGRVLLSGTNILPLPIRMKLSNLILLPLLKTRYFVGLASTSLRLSPEATMLYRESVRQMSYLAMWRITQQSANFRVERNSKLSTAAALIVAGQMEHPLVLQSMKLLLATLPYGCGYLAPGGRHGWIGESTDLFNRLLQAWFGEGSLPPELIPVEP